MALFDEIYCKYKLPDDAPECVKECPGFQTYDLGQGMGQYTITEDGQLLCDSTLLGGLIIDALGGDQTKIKPIPIKYVRKRIEMCWCNLRGGSPGKGKQKGLWKLMIN